MAAAGVESAPVSAPVAAAAMAYVAAAHAEAAGGSDLVLKVPPAAVPPSTPPAAEARPSSHGSTADPVPGDDDGGDEFGAWVGDATGWVWGSLAL